MQTIEVNGISYVSARDIEAYYKLTRKRTWQELQKAQLSHIKLLQSYYYHVVDVESYFNNFVRNNAKYNKIGLV
jgi:phage anti-repressor protein